MKQKYKVGYTTGVFDLFHIGHLNLLKSAKDRCEKLIVGVTVDSLVRYKFKNSVIPFIERIEIVRSIKYVDEVIPQDTMDKLAMHEKLKFDVIFVGDDWKGTDKWERYEQEFKELGVDTIYFPYTKTTSSSLINNELIKLRDGR
jgi:glycerol-3-phosphate cytidylyltransferase